MKTIIVLALTAAFLTCSFNECQTQEIIDKTVKLEQVTEHLEEVQTVVEEIEEEPMFYNIPLDEEIQFFVIEEAEAHGIAPEIIFAMIYRESNYRIDAVGDSGNSLGLMQIQPRWHEERMQKLGCSDLLNAEQNIKVGVDILAELIEKYDGNIEMALTAYNMGCSGAYKNCFQYGKYSSKYSEAVIEKSEEIKGGEI